MDKKLKIIAVTGPTATGKTALAVNLARQFDGEIVSVDSRQVYKFMDLGTGKDLEEYGNVPFHLIDIADPKSEVYNLGRFCRDAFQAVGDIQARGHLPILCGGTALFLDALLHGYRLPGGALPPRQAGTPRLHANPDAAPSFSPPFELEPLVLGVLYDRAVVRSRIEARLDARFAAGMVEEVQRLHDEHGVSFEQLEFFGLEYREIARFLQQQCTFDEMRQTLLDRIRQFAKRQDIFFRKMEREGIPIYWCKDGCTPDPEQLVRQFLTDAPLPSPAIRLSEINYGKKNKNE